MNLNFDFQPFRDELNMSQSDIDDLLDFTVKEVTASFAEEWEKQASENLNSTRNQYMRSIVVTNPAKFQGAVELIGDVPNMVESGRGPFDMKPFLLNGKNSKVDKYGNRYNIVPFSIGTPEALEENFTTIMPTEVYEVAKELETDISTVGGMRSQGVTSDMLPEKYREKITKNVFNPKSERFEEYTHKNSIYEGITKYKSEVTNQNSYMSFRRVSEKSDPLSWIHSGFTAMNLAEKALQELNVPRVSSNAIDNFLSQHGFASE